jgi:pimeloyl-ACP methyl ester carboxylesterase
MLHGAPGSQEQFAPLVDALAASHRILIPSMPGYGKSTRLHGDRSLGRVTRMLEAALTERGISEVAIVGHSLGGYRALALAFSRQITVRRLVVLAGFAGLDEGDRALFRGFAKVLREGTVDLRPVQLARAFPEAYAAANPKDASIVSRLLDSVPPEVLADEMDAIADSEDLRPRLGALSTPIVVRVGELDAAVPIAWCGAIASGAPKASLEIVPGVGHMLLMENRAATVASVVAALSH